MCLKNAALPYIRVMVIAPLLPERSYDTCVRLHDRVGNSMMIAEECLFRDTISGKECRQYGSTDQD